jgi:uncharacterized membrane protein YhiD involved in acid resistance
MALFQEKYHTNFMKTKDLLQNFKTNNKLLFIALTTIILVVILYILISSILSSIETNKKLKTIKDDYQYVLSSIEEFEKSINYKSEASTLDSLLLELAKKYSVNTKKNADNTNVSVRVNNYKDSSELIAEVLQKIEPLDIQITKDETFILVSFNFN